MIDAYSGMPTVKQRMEALGWDFSVDEDVCAMTPMKLRPSGHVRGAYAVCDVIAYGTDSVFQDDLEQC